MLYRAFEAMGAARLAPNVEPTSLQRIPRLARPLLGGAILAGLAASLAGRFGEQHWILDLSAHFPMQIALGLALAGLVAVALGARRLAFLAALGLIWNLALLAPRFIPPAGAADGPAPSSGAPAPAATPELDILIFNILRINPRKAAVLEWIRAEEPDIIGLIEIDQGWLEAVEAGLPEYEILQRVAAPRDDNFGMLLALRRDRPALALESARLREDTTSTRRVVPAIEARFRVEDRPLDLLLVHTMPPKGSWQTAMRDDQLAEAVAWAEASPVPALVAGDFNLTPFSPRFARLLEGGRLQDSGRGRGYQSTWPFAPFRWLGIPIDHALYTPGLRVIERRIGPGFGSDHGSLWLRVGLAPSSPGPFSHQGRRGVGGDWAGGASSSGRSGGS